MKQSILAIGLSSLIFLPLESIRAQQSSCMVTCGTQPVSCDQVTSLLCGTFTGAVDIHIPDPNNPGSFITVANIDLGLVLDDNGPGGGSWQGYVSPAKSIVFPIVSSGTQSQQGPQVYGSNQGRQCTSAAPCLLVSQPFYTPVSSAQALRQFFLTITSIGYQDQTQTPNALLGTYQETIDNYTLGRTIVVNGTFRLDRAIPIVGSP